jgi:hypothetical protein
MGVEGEWIWLGTFSHFGLYSVTIKFLKAIFFLIFLKIYLFYVILDFTKENRTHNLRLLRALAAMKVCKTSYGY